MENEHCDTGKCLEEAAVVLFEHRPDIRQPVCKRHLLLLNSEFKRGVLFESESEKNKGRRPKELEDVFNAFIKANESNIVTTTQVSKYMMVGIAKARQLLEQKQRDNRVKYFGKSSWFVNR